MSESNREWSERFQRVFVPNYRPAEIVIERGEGVEVIDVEGNRYLDMVSGIAVNALGHHHPKLVAALNAQAERVLHTSNLYLNRPSIELAEKLCELSFAEAVFFCNSGAEANEAAIKMARRHAWERGERSRTEIVSFLHSFHGRTLGALAATGQPKYHEGFAPLPGDFVHVPFGDPEAAHRAIGPRTAAVIVEPIQGEGGVRAPPSGFLAALREMTVSRGALLVFDEVQVGIGRTGRMFAYQGEDVVPDIMTLAKSLGGGLPLGATLAARSVAKALAYGVHGTTFGGNPVACSLGQVVLDVVSAPGFLDQVRRVADRLFAGLAALGERHPVIEDVRGRGLLIGAALRSDARFTAADVVRACRERGVLVHVAGPGVVRLAPPLILEAPHVDWALAVLDDALGSLSKPAS